MKKLFWFVVILLLVTGGVAVGYKTYHKAREQAAAATGKKKRAQEAVAVEAVLPRKTDLRDQRLFSGTLKPWSVFDVAPKVSGRLEELEFNIGDPIPPGALIARIDDTEYKQQYAQAAADLEVAKAQRKEAEVILQLRRTEYERQSTLIGKQIGSQAQFESAQSSLLSQEATVAMKSAEVKRAEAALANAAIKLQDTGILADWTGAPRYTGDRYVDEGALLQTNQPIISVAEIDRLRAAIFVIERDYPHLRVGQTAELTTDAYPDRIFTARVFKISQILQENSRQAYVLLEIPNADLALKPGMFVRVYLEFDRRTGATVVPRSALIKRGGRTGVFRLSPNDAKAYFVEVQTGIVADEEVEIISPELTAPVITLGNHLLSDGAPVLVPEAFAGSAPATTKKAEVPATDATAAVKP